MTPFSVTPPLRLEAVSRLLALGIAAWSICHGLNTSGSHLPCSFTTGHRAPPQAVALICSAGSYVAAGLAVQIKEARAVRASGLLAAYSPPGGAQLQDIGMRERCRQWPLRVLHPLHGGPCAILTDSRYASRCRVSFVTEVSSGRCRPEIHDKLS